MGSPGLADHDLAAVLGAGNRFEGTGKGSYVVPAVLSPFFRMFELRIEGPCLRYFQLNKPGGRMNTLFSMSLLNPLT